MYSRHTNKVWDLVKLLSDQKDMDSKGTFYENMMLMETWNNTKLEWYLKELIKSMELTMTRYFVLRKI